MERKAVRIWYDAEGDYLEVLFADEEGYFRETDDDQVMAKVDAKGNLIGFSVLKVSSLKEHPLSVALV
jgi:uncharacterized protein YuzE